MSGRPNLLMIPIEELKLQCIYELCLPRSFWWYLLRNWNLCAQPRAQRTLSFWWYLLRNWNAAMYPGGDASDIFWWYLLRNWNASALVHLGLWCRFWWYLLRNWNPDSSDCSPVCLIFWWYLLRNWNSIVQSKRIAVAGSFDDTYWGIETLKLLLLGLRNGGFWWYLLRNWNSSQLYAGNSPRIFWWYLLRNWNRRSAVIVFPTIRLLMIPIEELKLGPTSYRCSTLALLMIPIEELKPSIFLEYALLVSPFDDTYWGIETASWRPVRNRIQGSFDDTYWGIETKHPVQPVPVHGSFDDTYWGIETTMPVRTIMIRCASFWWYLLRNWNIVIYFCFLLMHQSFDDTYWGIETQ